MSATRELVHTDLTEHVLTITMDRPEARNALSRQMVAELGAAFARLDDDADCWVAVLQAEGPTFCAGADLKEALSSQPESAATTPPSPDKARRSSSVISQHRKPVIGCVEGQAWAGGLEMLLSCDLIVASTAATFALSEVKRGLLAIGGGLFRLPRRLPPAIAMEMILTGAPQPASAMKDHGLINRLAEPGDVRRQARELALLIAANSPVAVQAALAVTATSIAESWTDLEGFAGQREPFSTVRASEDFIEGLRAFSEKRNPAWMGR